KICQIGGTISAERTIDAAGRLVLPGGIDPHVHLSKTDLWENAIDDFESGTIAAAAGGITTVGNMTDPNRGEDLMSSVIRVGEDAKRNALVDFTQHPVLLDPSTDNVSNFPKLVEAGITSIKIFTIDPFGPFDTRIDDYMRAMNAAARSGILCMVHCEDSSTIRFSEEKLRKEGKIESRFFAETRPDVSERIATDRVIGISRITGAPVYIVHISSAASLAQCASARNEGTHVYVETRPIYLYFTKDRYADADGAKFAAYPPLRAAEDMNALWRGIQRREVDTFGSDHNPWLLAQKLDPKLNAFTVLAGMSSVETLLPSLFSEGVSKQRISLERFIGVTSSNPAKLLGMYPKKGTITIGSDADLTIWDPKKREQIKSGELHSRADFDLLEGWEIHGWPEYTISRGEVIFAKGQLEGKSGRGQQVKRSPFLPENYRE
ncbi:MAG TPA: amidohydrolase family protein, partial [Nitrososphaerales archaeon]|nr:amidohydrolase family protein [Nitrososphaerales archaeon]